MTQGRARSPFLAVLFVSLGFALLALSCAPAPALPSVEVEPSATPAAPKTFSVLDRPVVSNPPTQVEAGHLIFWGVCMACHGSQGQGLTDEWRQAAFGEDNNCWASKCHASNHPPQGFEFPRIVPALVGGSQVGPSTLVRFYAWHIFALSLAAGFVLIWHLFRVRRDGGIAAPPPAQRETPQRIPRFELVRREVLGMFVAGILLVLLSTFMPAPLAAPIRGNPTLGTDTRAPWFFLWVQQLLKFGDPFLLGVLVPLAALTLLAVIPYVLPGAT